MLHNTISRPPQGLENRNMTIVSSTNVYLYWQIKDKYIEGLQAAFNDFEFHKNNVFFSKPSKRIDIDFFFMIFSQPGRRRCRCTCIVMYIAQILQFLKKSSTSKKYQLSPFFDRAQQQGNAKQSNLIWSVFCSISIKWRGHYGTWADMGLSWLHEMKNDSGFKGVDGQEVLQG